MWSLPLPYRFSQGKYFVVDLPQPINFQGTAQINHLLQHGTAPTTVGHLLRTELELDQIELGASNILFRLDYTKWVSLLTDLWVKILHKFCHKRGVQIR